VVVVHTDNSYGREAYRAIRPYLAEAGICLTAAFPADPNDDSDATVDGLLDNVMATNTTGVIYLGNNMIIEAFLRRGEVKNNAGLLQWVVTDSVSLSETFPGQKYPRGLTIYFIELHQ
jgi:ABC-type branched-subunit amino acid transport system substrate-binding protein